MSPELGVVRIASPCPERWADMAGDDRVRFCDRCALKVYDLSGLDADEGRALFQKHEGGRLCVRFFQRRDGKVMTRDCTWGALLRAKWNQRLARGGVVALLLAAVLFAVDQFDRHVKRQMSMLMGDVLAGDPSADTPKPPPSPPPRARPMRAQDLYDTLDQGLPPPPLPPGSSSSSR